jgi:tape measure domain-containing protein
MAGRFSVEAVFKAVDRVTAPVSRMQNRVGKFTRGMSRGLRTVNKTLSQTTGLLKQGAKAALRFGAVGVGVLTASVGLLVREFSKVENAEAAFTPLLGGAERAREAVEALNATAASTPFQFETLASAANQLLPVMNGNIERTIKTLRMLGDTAGGNAQKLESITRGFTKAMLKGKVDMESLNMIAEAGVPIFGDLAAVMGTEVNEAFFKMISAGKVTTAQLTKAFEKMTTEGGIFFNGMEIASKTTTGLLSTFKDNVSLTAAELGGVLAPTIKDLIRGATAIAQRIRAWVKANRELISEKFLKFVGTTKTAISGFIDTLQTLNRENSILERLGEIVVGVAAAFAFLAEHGTTIATVIAGVVGLNAVLGILTGVLTAVSVVMAANPVTLLVLALVAAAAAIILAWEPIKAFFADLWGGVVDIFDSAVERVLAVVDRIMGIVSAVTGAVSAVGSGISDFFNPDENATGSTRGGRPQIVSPQERVARSIDEQRTTSTAEVTIKDDTGRAEVTSGRLGPGLKLQSSGAF